MTLLALIAGLFIGMVAGMIMNCPEGYEDEEHGFRLGRPEDRS